MGWSSAVEELGSWKSKSILTVLFDQFSLFQSLMYNWGLGWWGSWLVRLASRIISGSLQNGWSWKSWSCESWRFVDDASDRQNRPEVCAAVIHGKSIFVTFFLEVSQNSLKCLSQVACVTTSKPMRCWASAVRTAGTSRRGINTPPSPTLSAPASWLSCSHVGQALQWWSHEEEHSDFLQTRYLCTRRWERNSCWLQLEKWTCILGPFTEWLLSSCSLDTSFTLSVIQRE